MSDGTYLIEEHELADMEQHIDMLTRAIIQVNLLIKSSDGVVGLYNNGDIKLWEDLLKGGRDEVWLLDYSKAIEATEIEALALNDLPFDEGFER